MKIELTIDSSAQTTDKESKTKVLGSFVVFTGFKKYGII